MSASEADIQNYITNVVRCSDELTKFAHTWLGNQAKLDLEIDEAFQLFSVREKVSRQSYNYESTFRRLLDAARVRLAKERTLRTKDESLVMDKILSCLVLPETHPTSSVFEYSLAWLGDFPHDRLAYKEILDWLEEVDVAHHSGEVHPFLEYRWILPLLEEDYGSEHMSNEIHEWLSHVPRAHLAYVKILKNLRNFQGTTISTEWLRYYLADVPRDQPITEKIRLHIFNGLEGHRVTHKRLRKRISLHSLDWRRCKKEIIKFIDNSIHWHHKQYDSIRHRLLDPSQHERVWDTNRVLIENATWWRNHIPYLQHERERVLFEYVSMLDDNLNVHIATSLFHGRIVDDLRANSVFQSQRVSEVLRHCSSI